MTNDEIQSLDLSGAQQTIRTLLQEKSEAVSALDRARKEADVERIARDRGFPNPHLVRSYADSEADAIEIVDGIAADESKRNLWDPQFFETNPAKMSAEKYQQWRQTDEGKAFRGVSR